MKNKILWITMLLSLNICGLTAQVQKTIFVPEAGTLKEQLTEDEAKNITHLTLTGKINALDFKAMRDDFEKLEFLDLTNADIKLYVGKKGTYPEKTYVYPMNSVPAYAFRNKKTLKHVILSPSLKNIEDYAFDGCDNLQICQLKKKKPSNLLPNALNDSVTTVFVPLGSRDSYWSKPKWKPFNLVEGDVVSATISVSQPGTLGDEIRKAGFRPEQIHFLTVKGSLDQADFKEIRDNMLVLTGIDLSETDNGSIPDFTFAQKRFLMFVRFPKKLKSIGQRAFSGCTHIAGEIVLPESATEVSNDAFMGCDKITKILLNGKNIK